MSQMVLWVHPIITGYQKTSVFQRKGVNQAYVVLRVDKNLIVFLMVKIFLTKNPFCLTSLTYG